MDLPFMRTALARQGDSGLPAVRNPTWRLEPLLARRWPLGDFSGSNMGSLKSLRFLRPQNRDLGHPPAEICGRKCAGNFSIYIT